MSQTYSAPNHVHELDNPQTEFYMKTIKNAVLGPISQKTSRNYYKGRHGGRPTWDETWLEVAETVAHRSSCTRAKVGAVIVDLNQRVVATGYNGPAAPHPADTDLPCTYWCKRSEENHPQTRGYGFDCPAIHAEANALLYKDRVENATLYVTHTPCPDCAKLVSNAGIVEVVLPKSQLEERTETHEYLRMCGISVRFV